MDSKYTILTLNCKGLRHVAKRRSMFQYLKAKKADIILLQETHMQESDVTLWEQEWEAGNICPNPGKSNSAGQMVMTIKPMTIVENKIHEAGRLQEVIITDNNNTLRIFNIYGHNKEQLRIPLLKILDNALSVRKESDFTCIGGDFNIYLSNLLDKQGGNNKRSSSQVFLNNLIANMQCIDTWRNENPSSKAYTWCQKSPVIKCRLDYFLVPTQFVPFVKRTNISPSIKTDHKCVEIHIFVEKFTRGPGSWKFNCDVLNNKKYISDIKVLIDKVHYLMNLQPVMNWLSF